MRSNNVLDWTGLVHNRDNADLSLVTLVCVLLNGQYYAAEILPKQIAGAMQHETILFAVHVFVGALQCVCTYPVLLLYLSLLVVQGGAGVIWSRQSLWKFGFII